jgi:hypothetical protein
MGNAAVRKAEAFELKLTNSQPPAQHYTIHTLQKVTQLAQIAPMSDTPTQRYVPGALPPVLASKSSKKKRKTGKGTRSEDSPALSSVAIPDSTALNDKTQDASDVKDGPLVDSLPVDPHSTNGLSSSQHGLDEAKHSPVIDLFQKRIKTTNKKIVRLFYVVRGPTKMALPLTLSHFIGSNTRLCYSRR